MGMTEKSTMAPKDLYEILLDAQNEVGQGFFIHEDGQILHANEACFYISGYDLAELSALPSVFELVVPEQRGDLRERMRRRLRGQKVVEHYECTILHKDGRRVDVEIAVKPLQVDDRTWLVVLVRDITERKALEERLTYQALHDPLTDLPNRTTFMDRLERALASVEQREDSKVAVLFMDLDNFKVVNDS